MPVSRCIGANGVYVSVRPLYRCVAYPFTSACAAIGVLACNCAHCASVYRCIGARARCIVVLVYRCKKRLGDPNPPHFAFLRPMASAEGVGTESLHRAQDEGQGDLSRNGTRESIISSSGIFHLGQSGLQLLKIQVGIPIAAR